MVVMKSLNGVQWFHPSLNRKMFKTPSKYHTESFHFSWMEFHPQYSPCWWPSYHFPKLFLKGPHLYFLTSPSDLQYVLLFWYPCWVFWIRRLYFFYKVHFKLESPTFLNQGLSLHWAVCQHFMIPLQLLKWAYFSKQSDTINRQKVRNEAFVPCRWHMCVQNV